MKDWHSEYLTSGGALDGYSNFLYYNLKQDLTIIVLSNTANQAAKKIGRRLGALALGMPVAAVPARVVRELANFFVTADEIR